MEALETTVDTHRHQNYDDRFARAQRELDARVHGLLRQLVRAITGETTFGLTSDKMKNETLEN